MPSGTDAQQQMLRFFTAARSAGIRISAADSIEALRALDLVGYQARETVCDALALVIATTAEDRDRFDACFDRYFSRSGFAQLEGGAQAAMDITPLSDVPDSALASSLGQALLTGDRAELASLVETAANVVRAFGIGYSTQRALYARRMLDHMGLPGLDRELARLRLASSSQARALLDSMLTARARLTQEVHAFVENQFAVLARGFGAQARDEALQSIRLNDLDRDERDQMKRAVRAIAKRLATRYGPTRKRKRRGQLDVRRTLRRNLRHEGIPFITVWKKRKIDKPRVMVLCDVSGSVAPVAEFLLLFMIGLKEALANLRSFAFSSHLIETSDMIATQAPDQAVAAVLTRIGFGSSNYGRSLEDFETCALSGVDKMTTVIILGDARGNGTEPRLDILQRVFERARRVIWLNPEPGSAWGAGDSDMVRYAKSCTMVRVCNSVRHLEEIATEILNH